MKPARLVLSLPAQLYLKQIFSLLQRRLTDIGISSAFVRHDREELDNAGVTKDMAGEWCDFYKQVKAANPGNPSDRGRAELTQKAYELLGGENSLRETEQSTCVERLRIGNRDSNTIKLAIEPWGEELLIAPNQSFMIVAKGPAGGWLEVEVSGATITLYGWPGSIISVPDDERLIPGCRVPAPSSLPPHRMQEN